VILLAYRDFDEPTDWEDEDALATNLTLAAIVGIRVSFFWICSFFVSILMLIMLN
jgi:hypothetical protein